MSWHGGWFGSSSQGGGTTVVGSITVEIASDALSSEIATPIAADVSDDALDAGVATGQSPNLGNDTLTVNL